MRYTLSDKLIAYLALVSGLSISAVAIYYSVAGLMAIFAAALIPIMIMGIVLEIGKLAATVWLKQNWIRAPRFLKAYLLTAIFALMLLTSMGIFGYLSKAHLDQAVPTGDVAAKVALLDEKIKTEKDNVETARIALKQMDAQVDARLSRSDDEKGAERAVQIRRQQQAERGRLQKEIGEAQARIAKLNEERAPIASELRKVEAEVGPIKYIAALIYGDNPDSNLLEKAVRWVIIVIVLVFDPLAVILLLASQYSFQWFRSQEEENRNEPEAVADQSDKNEDEPDPEFIDNGYVHSPWPFPVQRDPYKEEPKEDDFKFLADDKDLYPEGKSWEENNSSVVEKEKIDESNVSEDPPVPLEQWNEMIAEAEKAIKEEDEKQEQEILDSVPHTEKEAMTAWKQDNPDSSLKLQRQLFDKGLIKELPWMEYLRPKADYTEEEEAAIEAAKWAKEQLAMKEEISWMEHDENGNQIKKTKEGYQQNEEQNSSTLWQKIQSSKNDR
jgi:hypothetical protein